ncbi:hypothetical protein Tco_1194192 [Tanacetum coccineum]
MDVVQNGFVSFIRIADPTKVRIGERQCDEDEPRLLETTVGRVVLLLPVAPVCTSGELEASVDKLFDEWVVPMRQRKRKTDVVDAGGSSHPPKKLREDHGTLGGPSVAERESEDHIDSVTGLNLRAISSPQRFVISSDSSHHSGANIAEAEVDSFVRPSVLVITAATTITLTADPAVVVKEKIVKPSVFVAESSSAGGVDPNAGVFLDLTGSDFLVSGVRTVIDPEFDLQKVYVPRWSVTNGSCLDDSRVSREMVDEFAPPKFFASIRGMDHDQLFTEFNGGAARQISLSAEVRMHAEYNIKEKRRLKTVVDEQEDLLKSKEGEIESLKAQLLLKEAEAAEAVRLRAKVSNFEVTEKSLRDEVNALNGRNLILEKEHDALDVKVTDLAASVKVREQEVADLDIVVTSVKFQNDSLVKQVHEPETSSAVLREKVLAYENCTEQLEKFQDEQMKVVNENSTSYMLTSLKWPFTWRRGRVLVDVAAYNPSAEVDYASALQQLQSVNFSLLAELKLNKDSSVETLMNILRLEDTLAARLGLNESQPHVDQLMVPIHHSPDQTVIGATALSLSLDVSHARVRRIRENIASYRSALRDVFIPLADPLSTVALEGTGGTSGTVHATADTITALSMFVASTGTVRPVSIDDYEVAGADDLVTADGNVADEDTNPFPNVDDAELNVPE